ncbi:MAG TPA: hypothetical protein VM840_00325, partial [Actinomycetota bacterium]|nr:hypothetical protein [Actinomycetota bacterium]
LPEPSTITLSGTFESGYTIYLESEVQHDEVVRFYARELPARGWTINACVTTETPEQGRLSVVSALRADLMAAVTVGRGEEPTHKKPYDFYVLVTRLPQAAPSAAAQPCPPQ